MSYASDVLELVVVYRRLTKPVYGICRVRVVVQLGHPKIKRAVGTNQEKVRFVQGGPFPIGEDTSLDRHAVVQRDRLARVN